MGNRCPHCLQPLGSSGCVNWQCPPLRNRVRPARPVGWQCPECRMVHAPWVNGCTCEAAKLQNLHPEPDTAMLGLNL